MSPQDMDDFKQTEEVIKIRKISIMVFSITVTVLLLLTTTTNISAEGVEIHIGDAILDIIDDGPCEAEFDPDSALSQDPLNPNKYYLTIDEPPDQNVHFWAGIYYWDHHESGTGTGYYEGRIYGYSKDIYGNRDETPSPGSIADYTDGGEQGSPSIGITFLDFDAGDTAYLTLTALCTDTGSESAHFTVYIWVYAI